MKELRVPALIVHCDQDPVIPFALGQKVYNLAPQPKYFLEIDALCHEEAALYAPAKYRLGFQEFLAAVEKNQSQ
jgi:fermentation-respiration switch protein FrsA (DUF1100 family)